MGSYGECDIRQRRIRRSSMVKCASGVRIKQVHISSLLAQAPGGVSMEQRAALGLSSTRP